MLLGPLGGVEDDLYLTVPVAQIDKHQASVVTPAVDPAADCDGLSDLGLSQLTALMGP